jgi:hypothetical protein
MHKTVFDASLNLQDSPASPELYDLQLDVSPDSAPYSGGLAPDLQDTNSGPRQTESLAETESVTQAVTDPERQDRKLAFDEQVQAAGQVTLESAQSIAGIDADEVRYPLPPATDMGPPEHFSFIREPQARDSAWSGTGVRASLMTLTLVLLCTLLLQRGNAFGKNLFANMHHKSSTHLEFANTAGMFCIHAGNILSARDNHTCTA